MLRLVTAGESWSGADAWISGFAGVPIFEFIQTELHRRQLGYGRGGRQKIEKDRVEAVGNTARETIGSMPAPK
jgi:chorismate synthase